MASGSQLNRWGELGGVPMLYVDVTQALLTAPTTGYGTIPQIVGGQNTQAPPNYPQWRGNDSGPYVTPIGMSKVVFQMIPVGTTVPTGFSVTVYGTNDMNAYLNYTYDQTSDPVTTSFTATQNQPGIGGTVYTLPASSWAQLPAPATENSSPDTAAYGNPLTPTNPLFFNTAPFVGYRVVLTARTGVVAGAVVIVGFGVP